MKVDLGEVVPVAWDFKKALGRARVDVLPVGGVRGDVEGGAVEVGVDGFATWT